MPTLSVGRTSGAGFPPADRLSSRSRRPRGRQRGITLVELLVVVTIIGLMAGLSFPAVSAGIDSVRLRSATDSVAGILNSAANRAERHQVPVEVVISRKSNAISLYSTEPGFTRELKMPGGVVIEAVLPPLPEGTDTDENAPRQLLLLPGGTVPAIGVQLGNHHGAHRVVRLDPMTGFPRVESVKSE